MKQKLSPRTLTVLNYHRVFPFEQENFLMFKPNVSASLELFSDQMDYLVDNFNVVSLVDVVNWFKGQEDLPDRPALITFDDGYLDNYLYAYPVLQERNIGATVFLTTDFIDRKLIFYWDLVAYCVNLTERDSLQLQGIGKYTWEDEVQKESVILNLMEDLKKLPDHDKKKAIEKIPGLLNVEIDEKEFYDLAMTWEQIVELGENGIDFGAHTVRHPILSRVSVEEANNEIVKSKERIEEKLGKNVLGFAYPNGQVGDFTPAVVNAVQRAGYEIAFSLISGPSPFREVLQEKFRVRRIFLSYKDNIPRFAAKLNGAARYF